MDNIEKIAEIASDWWSRECANPKKDNGDKSPSGAFLQVMLKTIAKPPAVDTSILNAFKEELKVFIIKRLKEKGEVRFRVDYAPDTDLADIAEKVKLPLGNFPWKTTMLISKDGCIELYHGYGAERQVLAVTKDFLEKRISKEEELLARDKQTGTHSGEDYWKWREEEIDKLYAELQKLEYENSFGVREER